MLTLLNRNTSFAAIGAVTIVGSSGLMLERSLDRAYESALPEGTVEVREVQTAPSGDLAIAVVPTVEASCKRPAQLAEVASRGCAQR